MAGPVPNTSDLIAAVKDGLVQLGDP